MPRSAATNAGRGVFPIAGDCSERVFTFGDLGPNSGFAVQGRVDAFRYQGAGVVGGLAGVVQAHGRVSANGIQVRLASKSVAQPP